MDCTKRCRRKGIVRAASGNVSHPRSPEVEEERAINSCFVIDKDSYSIIGTEKPRKDTTTVVVRDALATNYRPISGRRGEVSKLPLDKGTLWLTTDILL